MSKNFNQFRTLAQNPSHSSVQDVDPDEVLEHKAEVHLIDVRRPDEWIGELGHIQGAQLLTLDYLPQKISELPKDETIVFICRSGGRSGQATEFAKQQGFVDVFNMKGGMILWNEKGFEITTDE